MDEKTFKVLEDISDSLRRSAGKPSKQNPINFETDQLWHKISKDATDKEPLEKQNFILLLTLWAVIITSIVDIFLRSNGR